MKKNLANIEITRPNQVLIVMRALPGAGKSTRAKQLVGEGVIHSTDDVIEARGDYFEHFRKMDEAQDWSAHGTMHNINFNNSIASMKAGFSPVIIDNTNIRIKEARKYIEAALQLGYDDKNIIIEDLGDGGNTLEVLAARNAHGVPFEVLESMQKSYKESGKLTVKRIVETAGEKNVQKVLYSAIVLDDKSRSKLLVALGHHIPEGWKVIVHHMTVAFAKPFPEQWNNFLNANCELKAVAIGKSDMVIAVKVEGPSENKIPHITLAVNEAAGGKPVMSNAITDWVDLDSYINLSGIGREITPQKLN